MERNREQPGSIVDASGRIYANQRAQTLTSNNMSIQVPKNNITLELRPSYPLTTMHYSEYGDLSDIQPHPPGNANKTASCSSRSTPMPSHCAAPPMLRGNLASPSTIHSYISKEEYNRVVRENVVLKLELEVAKEAAETATKACRDLAAWTIWERNRLMHELEEVKETHRAFINDEVDQLMAEEADRLPFCQ